MDFSVLSHGFWVLAGVPAITKVLRQGNAKLVFPDQRQQPPTITTVIIPAVRDVGDADVRLDP
jgi:hypothetical protein